MAVAATMLVKIGADISNYLKGVDTAQQRTQKMMSNLGHIAVVAGAALVAGTVAIAKKSIVAFGNFQKGMNEVFTLLPGISAEAMDKMSSQVKAFAIDFAVLPEQVIPALYQAISAGVPQENVFSFLETAQKAAKGGVTELETAVNSISSVVNAYGAEVLNATAASDLMFTAVRLGKTTFGELAQSLFQVTPTASALGVQFGDVTAALAAMTAQGVPTTVATTQLRQMFVELSKAGGNTEEVFTRVAGKTFKNFISAGGNVAGALKLLEKAAADQGLGMADMFGSVEAGNAALALSGKNLGRYVGFIDEMSESAGATQVAFDKMNTGVNFVMDRIKTKISVAMIDIGEKLVPTFEKFAGWLDTNMPAIIDTVVKGFNLMSDAVMGLLDVIAAASRGEVAHKGTGWFAGLSKNIEDEIKNVSGLGEALNAISDWVRNNLVFQKVPTAQNPQGEWKSGPATTTGVYMEGFNLPAPIRAPPPKAMMYSQRKLLEGGDELGLFSSATAAAPPGLLPSLIPSQTIVNGLQDQIAGIKGIEQATQGAVAAVNDLTQGEENLGVTGTGAMEGLTDATNRFISSVAQLTDTFANFGSMFEKVVIERMSPEKILRRLQQTFKAMTNWTSSLQKLQERGVSESIINSLRGMGLAGAGITAGLAKMSTSQLETATGLMGETRYLGGQQAYETVRYEHSGKIEVYGLTAEGQLIDQGIIDMLAAEIKNGSNRYVDMPGVSKLLK